MRRRGPGLLGGPQIRAGRLRESGQDCVSRDACVHLHMRDSLTLRLNLSSSNSMSRMHVS